MTDNSFSDGTYVISSMDSGNTRPYPLWNGISSSEARTYDLQCFLWTRSAGEKDPASFWYSSVSRISTVRVETLFDIKSKGDGTYTIRPVGNTACGLGAVEGRLAIAPFEGLVSLRQKGVNRGGDVRPLPGGQKPD